MNMPKDTQRGCIAICSRGLVHSRTMQWVTDFLQSHPAWKALYTHDESIPDAQNEITNRALSIGCEFVLYVEEDTVPPAHFFDLLTADPVQCLDYPLVGGTRAVHADDYGTVVFCGMGCLLVRADVFRQLPYPWFTTKSYTVERDSGKERLFPLHEQREYGGQDVAFCYALQEAGIPIRLISEIQAQHLRVTKLGTERTNHGCHEVMCL